MPVDDVTQAVNKAVYKKIMSEIDIDALAAKLRPDIEKGIEKSIRDAMKSLDVDDLVHGLFWDEEDIDLHLANVLRKSLGLPVKKPKPRKRRR